MKNVNNEAINPKKRYTGYVIEYKKYKGTIDIPKFKNKDNKIIFYIDDVQTNVPKDKMIINGGQKVKCNIEIEPDGQTLHAKNINVRRFRPIAHWVLLGYGVLLFFIFYFFLRIKFIVAYLLAINYITFVLYYWDKKVSYTDKNGNYIVWDKYGNKRARIPEFCLHCCEYLGGFFIVPLASRIWNHKKNAPYTITYYFIVITQLLIIIAYLLVDCISNSLANVIFLSLVIAIFFVICLDNYTNKYSH